MKRLLTAILVMLGLMTGAAFAGDLYPEIPKATGEAHPEGNEYMRVNHMDLLRHDRNLTMREGARDTDNSLAECLDCHAVKGPDAKPVTIKSEEHFCRVCHDFAAVRIDCFQCHNSAPVDLGEANLLVRPEDLIDPTEGMENLVAYLEGVSK